MLSCKSRPWSVYCRRSSLGPNAAVPEKPLKVPAVLHARRAQRPKPRPVLVPVLDGIVSHDTRTSYFKAFAAQIMVHGLEKTIADSDHPRTTSVPFYAGEWRFSAFPPEDSRALLHPQHERQPPPCRSNRLRPRPRATPSPRWSSRSNTMAGRAASSAIADPLSPTWLGTTTPVLWHQTPETTACNIRGDSHAESQVGNTKQIITSIGHQHPDRSDEAAAWPPSTTPPAAIRPSAQRRTSRATAGSRQQHRTTSSHPQQQQP